MGRLLAKYRDWLLGAGLFCAALALMAYPQESMEAARDGLSLCANVIVPSLFPFFALAALVVELGLSRYLGKLLEGVMAPLFRVNGACASALALGFVGGYPVGARTAIALYEKGQCSKTEAERLLAFCNNSGPAFIFGVGGAGVFASGKIGLLLYLIHLLASLCVGVLFRFYKPSQGPGRGRTARVQFEAVSFPAAFARSVTGSLTSCLNICAFVLLFTVVLRLLALSGALDLLAGGLCALLAPLGLTDVWARKLLTGLLEISSGVSSLTGEGTLSGRLSMAAFILGWAGLSVHCQVLSFLEHSGLSMKTYFVGKLLHGGISAVLAAGLARFLPLEQPVSAYLAEQVDWFAELEFSRALFVSAGAAWGLWLIFVGLSVAALKKSSRKMDQRRV